MSDRVPIPIIAGSLSPWVGVDIEAFTVLADTDLVSIEMTVLTAPTDVGGAVVELRRWTGVGTSALLASVTIAQAQSTGSFTGTVPVTAGMELFLRVTDDGGNTSDLSGSVAFTADVLFTSLERVKSHAKITGTTNDSLILEMIGGVSKMIQQFCQRCILQRTFTDERYDPSGNFDELLLNQYPIIGNPVVKQDGVTLTINVDYSVDLNSGILRRVSGDVKMNWSGEVLVTYTAGFVRTPADIRLAATKQVRHEFRQSAHGGDRLGERAHQLETGGSSTWEPDGLLPSTREAIAPYRQLRAAA